MLPPVQLIPPNFQNNRNSEQGGNRQFACSCEFSLENSSFYCALSRTPCGKEGTGSLPVPASFLSKTRLLLCALAHALRQGGYRHFVPVPASFLSKTRLFTVRSRARLAARIGGAAGLSTGASERSERVKRMSGSEPRIAWFLCRLAGTKSRPKEKKTGN